MFTNITKLKVKSQKGQERNVPDAARESLWQITRTDTPAASAG